MECLVLQGRITLGLFLIYFWKLLIPAIVLSELIFESLRWILSVRSICIIHYFVNCETYFISFYNNWYCPDVTICYNRRFLIENLAVVTKAAGIALFCDSLIQLISVGVLVRLLKFHVSALFQVKNWSNYRHSWHILLRFLSFFWAQATLSSARFSIQTII